MAGVSPRLNSANAPTQLSFQQGNGKGKPMLKDKQGNPEPCNLLALRGAINSTSSEEPASLIFERQLNSLGQINTLTKAQQFYSPRWLFQMRDNETGSDAGSNLYVQAFHDNGSVFATPAAVYVRGAPSGSVVKTNRVQMVRVAGGEQYTATGAKVSKGTSGGATLVGYQTDVGNTSDFEFEWSPPDWPTDGSTVTAYTINGVTLWYNIDDSASLSAAAMSMEVRTTFFSPAADEIQETVVVSALAGAFPAGALTSAASPGLDHRFAITGGLTSFVQVANQLRPTLSVIVHSDATGMTALSGKIFLAGLEVNYSSTV